VEGHRIQQYEGGIAVEPVQQVRNPTTRMVSHPAIDGLTGVDRS
jgi:hypothetical protein